MTLDEIVYELIGRLNADPSVRVDLTDLEKAAEKYIEENNLRFRGDKA